ncbi:hypothetical protein QJS04_geneDACA016784 [Acorus gramineus]|uniref:Pentatricopeptide repeat-containing protein n=1 Tax=Acorus gramineus TaxID=55184 RepID=A0AAV9BJ99_ACOGR|nr:hypothetical protein QJS04_geneDACA016784 [Acorus gramineus]
MSVSGFTWLGMIKHLTLFTHNILINSLCKLNRIDVGLSVLCGLFKRGYEPEVVTFTTLIKGFCFTDKIRLAVVLSVDMSKKGCPVNVVTYGTLIDGLYKVADTGTALRLLRRMEESGLRPYLKVYNAMIDGIEHSGLAQACREPLWNGWPFEEVTRGLGASY